MPHVAKYVLNHTFEPALLHAYQDAGVQPDKLCRVFCDADTAALLNVLLGHLQVSYLHLEQDDEWVPR